MIVKTFVLVCDGCGQWSTTSGALDPDEAWQRATAVGWSTGPITDPACLPDHHCGRCTALRRIAEQEHTRA